MKQLKSFVPKHLYRLPYEVGGDRVTSVDCFGLVVLVQKLMFNRSLDDIDFKLSSAKDTSTFIQQFDNHHWKKVFTPAQGRVAVMGRRFPFHIGVCIESKILHTTESTGVVLMSPLNINQQLAMRILYYLDCVD